MIKDPSGVEDFVCDIIYYVRNKKENINLFNLSQTNKYFLKFILDQDKKFKTMHRRAQVAESECYYLRRQMKHKENCLIYKFDMMICDMFAILTTYNLAHKMTSKNLYHLLKDYKNTTLKPDIKAAIKKKNKNMCDWVYKLKSISNRLWR